MGQGRGGGAHAAHDIFAQFFGFGFGGGGGGGEDQTPRGDTIYAVLEVTLKDAYLGNTFRVTRDKGIYEEAPGTRECKCKQKVVTQQLGHGMFQQYTTRSCEECPNLKLVRKTDTVTVSVEPGMQDGQEIQVFEEGEPIVDGEPGDLIFVVRILPHSYFSRQGDDLHVVATISLLEALVGFKKKIEHVDGHMVETVSTDVTRHGQVVKIAGEGMPRYEKEGRGDLHIKYNVAFPKSISSSQAKTLKQMFSDASWNVHEEL